MIGLSACYDIKLFGEWVMMKLSTGAITPFVAAWWSWLC